MSDLCAVKDCGRPLSSKGYCKLHAERVRRSGHPGRNPRPRRSLEDRLWPKVDRSGGPDACWPFTGLVTEQGYGRIRTGVAGEPTVGAHRAAYQLTHPGEPAAEVYDHTCHDPMICDLGPKCPHRRCCNPAHLKASTIQENSSADRQWTRAQLTHCPANHPYDEENTYTWTRPNGGKSRRCIRCNTEAARRYRSAA